ncbi:hypothetical protein INR59_16750 [Serratia marcescens]|uniref:hypothetical protein n=1 Tax=Serratia marcescens TaxID=615 RepID=UPI001873F85E|nr:hypothetical protein [Serratia marcescens]MBE5255621.1 hypothetical protein [Serratia marcescens]MBE5299260.1 hypothetical protein [Serratia marcescens]MBE5303209.1 hypothetical protein [Serratia marcescens]
MTLTTEQLRARAKFWREKAVDAKWESVSIAQDMLQNAGAFDELAANREAQPVAVTDEMALAFHRSLNDGGIGESDLEEIKVGLRGALCNITAPPAAAVPEDVQHLKNVQELYHSQEERLFALAQRIKGASFNKYSHTTAQAIDVLEREIFGDDGDACRAAMLAQPVSSGYKLPPHVYRELVNSLRDTAVKFSGTEQLRERLNTALSKFIEPDHPHTRTVAPEGGEWLRQRQSVKRPSVRASVKAGSLFVSCSWSQKKNRWRRNF